MKLFQPSIPSYEEALSFFAPDEGELIAIYGRIGSGKTTLATTMVADLLSRGQVVYTTWHINWDGFDERWSFSRLLKNLFFWDKRYFKFDASNWHYLDVFQDDIWDKLEVLNNCHIFFDDVIVQLFDSYEGTKFAKKKRQWAFTTRHYDRTIVLVTQRTTQIQVALRSQVNRFYRCTKVASWPWLILRREEFQDMEGEDVNENADPVSSKLYIPSRAILNAFHTKSLRMQGIPEIVPAFQAFDYRFLGRLVLVFRRMLGLKPEHTTAGN